MSLLSKWEKLSPKTVFLIDGIGAMATVTMLMAVLSNRVGFFGVRKDYLQILGLVAAVFSIYSFVCYFSLNKNWKPFLKIIAIANLLYCLITLGLIGYLYTEVTVFAVLYFAGEVIVVFMLVFLEYKKIKQYS